MMTLRAQLTALTILLFFVTQASAQDTGSSSGQADIQSIQREFKEKNISFDNVSKKTWEQLDGSSQKEISNQYLKLKANIKTTSDVEAKIELNKIAVSADYKAFRSLQVKGVIDPLILQGNNTDNAAPQMISMMDSERYGASYYRGLFTRLGIQNSAVVSPGTPDPQAPGSTLAQQDQVIPVKGRLSRLFNPNGFLEVVRIEFSVPGSCTGTLLSPNVVLTAAHCVADKQAAQVKIRLPMYSPQNIERCKKTMLESSQYEQCLEFQTSGVTQIRVHNKYDPNSYENDVAYVVLDAPRKDGAYARVHFVKSIPDRITLAGYGDNGIELRNKLRMQYALEVGWHSGNSMSMQEGYISWLYSPKNEQSATCLGDSGGPIYDGDYDGGVDATQHSIFSITSQGSSKTCENFRVRQTNLATKDIKSWICNELKSVVADCGAI